MKNNKGMNTKEIEHIIDSFRLGEYPRHLTAGDFYGCDNCGAMGACKCHKAYNQALIDIKSKLTKKSAK